jgi:predicted N-acetyltransferase YhbS
VDVHVQPERTIDREPVETIHCRAFDDDRESRLVHELRVTPAYIRELSLVARLDEMVVGHIMMTRMEIETEAEPIAALALAPLAVDPDHHGRGIGLTLMNAGLNRAVELGHRAVVALGDLAYLSRFGFGPIARFGLKAPFEVTGRSWLALELVPEALSSVSGTLSLAPPFDYVMGH